jgi:hypothetical protein
MDVFFPAILVISRASSLIVMLFPPAMLNVPVASDSAARMFARATSLTKMALLQF